ncbi:MAG: class I SAM-dependent methyltransferase [Nitrospiraceae bacterium]|nr:MAG: class I SAM-dependent methyltransferase [Nitrospiraceae bacterium]
MKNRNKFSLETVFTSKYYKAYNLHSLYTLNIIFSIFHKVNITDCIKSDFISCEGLMKHFDFSDQAKCSINWMLNFLVQTGYLEKTMQNKIIFFKLRRDIPLSQAKQISSEILELDNNWYPFVELVDNIAFEYESFLKGYKSGIELLFYKEKMQLWNNYFNNNFGGYSVFNIYGAYGMAEWFPQKDNGKILELGGGTGGAAVMLFYAYKRANILDKIEKYIFSDVSPVFLRTGNRILMEQFPELEDKVELKIMDFNKSLSSQKIQQESFDAVYAVNALHVSHDLIFSLKEIHHALKENGILVISELVRTSEEYVLPQEFIFTLLESYYNVQTDPLLRKNIGFLTTESWKRHFEMAGFKNIEMITNADCSKRRLSSKKDPVFMLVIKGQKIKG